jgi:23S rRNA pseudouridine1911/1915/1917 synthase
MAQDLRPGTPLVLYEDNHLIAVHKPAGMPSQADASGDAPITDWVADYLRVKYDKPGNVYVGLLHRLDRPVAGVLLCAKTSKAASRLSEAFQTRAVQKHYHVITLQAPPAPSGTLQHFIGSAPGTDKNIQRAYTQAGPERKAARLHYRVLAQAGGLHLLEVELETGRKHQIRAQLAAAGCTIVGDAKYGRTDFLPDKSIALLSYALAFAHPVSKEAVRITAQYPPSWPWNQFAAPEV